MNHEHLPTPEEAGHEPTTLGTRGILVGLLCVAAALLASMAIIAGLMAYFVSREAPPPVVGVPGSEVTPPPGTPMLNADQDQQLEKLRTRENQILTEYAWVDRDAGVARIPIRRAMEILSKNSDGLSRAHPARRPRWEATTDE